MSNTFNSFLLLAIEISYDNIGGVESLLRIKLKMCCSFCFEKHVIYVLEVCVCVCEWDHLSPISCMQSGCCKPPAYCGFQSKNATYWIAPKTGPAVSDQDCKIWSNVQKELCFDCESCKIAVLDNIKKDWRIIAIINSIILVIVIIVYSIGCCALRSNSYRGYSKYRVPA